MWDLAQELIHWREREVLHFTGLSLNTVADENNKNMLGSNDYNFQKFYF